MKILVIEDELLVAEKSYEDCKTIGAISGTDWPYTHC